MLEIKFMNKISIFLKMINIVKNWQVIFLVYFGIYNKEFYILYLKNGLKIKLRTNSTDLQAFANVWILKEYEVEGFEILENDVIIDIGGHVGLFALFASLNSHKGKIISIEPHPKNFNLLKENINDNNFHNVVVIDKAVTDKNKNLELFVNPSDDSAHSIHGDGENIIQIQGISLSEIMIENGISKCNILKMDCEGAEFEIIGSLSDDELLKIDKICLEYHIKEHDQSLLYQLKERLEKMDYNVIIKPTNKFLGMVYAKKRILERI